jgi:hypothetical protein
MVIINLRSSRWRENFHHYTANPLFIQLTWIKELALGIYRKSRPVITSQLAYSTGRSITPFGADFAGDWGGFVITKVNA